MTAELFTGEMGGLIAYSFATGAASGWGFSQKTVVKTARELIKTLQQEIAENEIKCEDRVKELRAEFERLDAQRIGRIQDLEERLIHLEESRLQIALDRNPRDE